MRRRPSLRLAWQLYASPVAFWQALRKAWGITRAAGLAGLHNAVRRKLSQPTIAIGRLVTDSEPSELSHILRSAYTASTRSTSLSVTAIIPTRGSQDLIDTCLQGIIRTVNLDAQLELVIVNNGRAIAIPADYPFPITVHHESRHFNWSSYNNTAARVATSTFLLFLNDDVEPIHSGWLDAMLNTAILPRVGTVGALLLYPDGRIQHFGIGINRAGMPYHEQRGDSADQLLARLQSRQREVFAVTGACMLARRDTFWSVRGFDPGFPLSYNDVDFCQRLQALGLRTVVTAEARLKHIETATRSLATGRRERARFWRKRDNAFLQ